jgi:hypothetical protein
MCEAAERPALRGEALETFQGFPQHLRARFAYHVVFGERPNQFCCLGGHRSEPASEVTDAEGGDRPQLQIRRGTADAKAPALDKRSVLIMQRQSDKNGVRVRDRRCSVEGIPQDCRAGCVVDSERFVTHA